MDALPEYKRHIAELPTEAVLREINMMNEQLLIATARYIEKPGPGKMGETNEPREKLFTLFGDALNKFHRDQTVTEEEAVNAFTTLIFDIGTKHARLLADYSEHVDLPDDERAQQAREHLYTTLQSEHEDGYEDFVDAVLAQLSDAVEIDWDVVADYQSGTLWAKTEKFRHKALETSGDILKIGAGTALGMFVVSRAFGKK